MEKLITLESCKFMATNLYAEMPAAYRRQARKYDLESPQYAAHCHYPQSVRTMRDYAAGRRLSRNLIDRLNTLLLSVDAQELHAARRRQILRVADMLIGRLPGYYNHFYGLDYLPDWRFPDGAENPALVYPDCIEDMLEYTQANYSERNNLDIWDLRVRTLQAAASEIPPEPISEALAFYTLARAENPKADTARLRLAIDQAYDGRTQHYASLACGALTLHIYPDNLSYSSYRDWQYKTDHDWGFPPEGLPEGREAQDEWLKAQPMLRYDLRMPDGTVYAGCGGILDSDRDQSAREIAQRTGAGLMWVISILQSDQS